MATPRGENDLRERTAAVDLSPDEFRMLGHQMVDRIADFLTNLRDRRVTGGAPPDVVRAALGTGSLPEHGTEAQAVLDSAADLLLAHSLFNGYPRFWGYITSSAAPIGALGDLLAAAVNPNVGSSVVQAHAAFTHELNRP
jgi:hypothetical protein